MSCRGEFISHIIIRRRHVLWRRSFPAYWSSEKKVTIWLTNGGWSTKRSEGERKRESRVIVIWLAGPGKRHVPKSMKACRMRYDCIFEESVYVSNSGGSGLCFGVPTFTASSSVGLVGWTARYTQSVARVVTHSNPHKHSPIIVRTKLPCTVPSMAAEKLVQQRQMFLNSCVDYLDQ